MKVISFNVPDAGYHMSGMSRKIAHLRFLYRMQKKANKDTEKQVNQRFLLLF